MCLTTHLCNAFNSPLVSAPTFPGPYFGKLKQHAERFVELTRTLQNLDEAYIEDVPNRFYNRNSQRVSLFLDAKTFRKRWPTKSCCSFFCLQFSAVFDVKDRQYLC